MLTDGTTENGYCGVPTTVRGLAEAKTEVHTPSAIAKDILFSISPSPTKELKYPNRKLYSVTDGTAVKFAVPDPLPTMVGAVISPLLLTYSEIVDPIA